MNRRGGRDQEVTGVKIKPTPNGVEVILETEDGGTGQVFTSSYGQTFFADVIALVSLWAIANAETLIGQEFFQLVYVFEYYQKLTGLILTLGSFQSLALSVIF